MEVIALELKTWLKKRWKQMLLLSTLGRVVLSSSTPFFKSNASKIIMLRIYGPQTIRLRRAPKSLDTALSSMYLKFLLPPRKAKFYVRNIYSSPWKGWGSCTKSFFSTQITNYFFPLIRNSRPTNNVEAKFHALKISFPPLGRLHFMYYTFALPPRRLILTFRSSSIAPA